MIARPKAAPIFYVDESIYSKVLVAELTAAGITFTQGQATAAQCAARIVALAAKMAAIAASQPKPFLYTFGLATGLAKVTLRARSR